MDSPTEPEEQPAPHLRTIVIGVVVALVFVTAVAFATRSVVNNVTWDLSQPGGSFWDFRDANYFSVRAWFDGMIPYDTAAYFATYPVGQEFSLLPPTYLALHVPFQLFSFPAAATVMFGLNLLGSVALATWSLRLARYRVTPVAILIASAVVIASNGGRNTLFSGQTTLLFTAGAYLALTAVSETQGAVGVFIALIKPAFGVPVALLAAFAGFVRRSVLGIVAAVVTSAILMIPFIRWAGGISELITILRDNVSFSASTPWIDVTTTVARIDATSTVAMLTDLELPAVAEVAIGLVIFGIAAWAIVTRRPWSAGQRRDAMIVLTCLTALTGIYHGFYDLVLLALPIFLAARRDFARGVRPGLRWILLGAMAVAWFNPFRLDMVSSRLGDSLNLVQFLSPGITGLALLVAFAAAVVVVRAMPVGGEVSGHSVRVKVDPAQ